MNKESIKTYVNNLSRRKLILAYAGGITLILVFLAAGFVRLSSPKKASVKEETLEGLIRRLNQLSISIEKEKGIVSSSAYVSDLVLVGIIGDRRQPLAIINNVIVGEGDSIGAFSVERINGDSVELRGDNDTIVTLRLNVRKR